MTEPRYSIVVCHYNMVNTVEESLRSILNQLDDRFEAVVVDGGSDDGSFRVLQRLSDEYPVLRIICTSETDHQGLAAERNLGVEEARGKHILLQMDADDQYDPVIKDFIYVYERIQEGFERGVYVSGKNINAAPRSFLLSHGPYREGIHRGEDTDMWRRMIADDAFVQLEHERLCESIGYNPGKRQLISNRLSEIEGDLRSGVPVRSRWRRAIGVSEWRMALLELLLIPIAWIRTLRGTHYSLPDGWENRDVTTQLKREAMTIPELNEREHICIDYDHFSDEGRAIFVTPYLK